MQFCNEKVFKVNIFFYIWEFVIQFFSYTIPIINFINTQIFITSSCSGRIKKKFFCSINTLYIQRKKYWAKFKNIYYLNWHYWINISFHWIITKLNENKKNYKLTISRVKNISQYFFKRKKKNQFKFQ